MKPFIFLLTFSSLVFFSDNTPAESHKTTKQYEKHSSIENAVENFIYSNTTSLPGQVTARIEKMDKHLTLPECPEIEPFMPSGNRLWGKTSIGVRCNSSSVNWTIYVSVEISVMGNVIHAARSISSGQTINYEDVAPQLVNLTQMPEGMFTDIAQVVGKVATTNLNGGQPIRPQMLRAPYVILRGQAVNLVVQGRGFTVSSEGRALNDAAEGQTVQIRNKSGRIITGLARINSIVEVQP